MNLLRPEEVSEMLGITRAALHALRRREQSFPQPIRVSQKVLRWNQAEIEKWLRGRKEIRLQKEASRQKATKTEKENSHDG